MEGYIIILCLSILSVGASVQQVRVQPANRDSVIPLPHTGSQFATESTLAVDCGQGTVKLTLRKDPGTGPQSAREDVGTELQSGRIHIAKDFTNVAATACSSPRDTYESGKIVAEATKENNCDRDDTDKDYFAWNVGIVEYSTKSLHTLERFFRYNATVKCERAYKAPGTVDQNAPAAILLPPHASSNDISFTFTKDEVASDHSKWTFNLLPNGEFAEGYSYEIYDLLIHPVGKDIPSAKLIDASCLMDKDGTKIFDDDIVKYSTKLEVRPFQFASEPEAKITLTVTVAVCETKSDEKRCPAVRPECSKTRFISEEASRLRSRRQVFESFQKKSVVFTATVAV